MVYPQNDSEKVNCNKKQKFKKKYWKNHTCAFNGGFNCFKRHSKQSKWPECEAQYNGVLPIESRPVDDTPWFRHSCKNDKFPLLAASWRGSLTSSTWPSTEKNYSNVITKKTCIFQSRESYHNYMELTLF